MQGVGWIQLMTIPQQHSDNMELELTKQDWERSKGDNELLIVNNKMQMEMAGEVIKLCDKKIAEFPEEIKEEIPAGVN